VFNGELPICIYSSHATELYNNSVDVFQYRYSVKISKDNRRNMGECVLCLIPVNN